MINYEELKTALTDISNICRLTDCERCSFIIKEAQYGYGCILMDYTPNNWLDNINTQDMHQFADRGAHLVEEGYIDE